MGTWVKLHETRQGLGASTLGLPGKYSAAVAIEIHIEKDGDQPTKLGQLPLTRRDSRR